jgi:Pol polyprotein, beta-barrel domain/GAG-pre-integrase domain
MQPPPDMSEQPVWGGQRFQSGSSAVDNEQTTIVGRSQPDQGSHPFSRTGITASSSDNLFHPVPTSPSYVFNLPTIPSFPAPNYHAYNQPSDTFSRPLHYPSAFTSYNNPAFAVPPLSPHVQYHQPYPSHRIHSPLRQPPPIPPRLPTPYNPDNQQQHQQQHFPPFQPAYIHHQPLYQTLPVHNPLISPSPSPSSAISSISKTLPAVNHISILTSKHDFFAWDEGVTSLIRANGLIGHILDPASLTDPCRPDLAPSPPPILSISSSADDIQASNRWWAEDNIAQHILVSRLGAVPRGLLPASNITTRTAFSIYQLLLQYYGTCNFADCTELLSSLHNSTCAAGRVQEFVSKWRTGLSKLQSAHFVFSIRICVSLFVRGLPSVPAFNTLRADLPRRIAAITNDQDYGAFISMTETVLELDTIFRPSSQLNRPSRGTPIAPGSLATPAIVAPSPPVTNPPDPPSRVSRPALLCNNCKSRGLRCVGHTDATCFQHGGGMEGRREEYLANKGKIHAMFAECLENALLLSDSDSTDIPHISSPIASPPLSPTLDSDTSLPPVAHLCVPSPTLNSDLYGDLYSLCDPESSSMFALASIDSSHLALVSFAGFSNSILDSGCTHHIIRDRTLFHSYTAKSISVGTANCGSLDAQGTGDVVFRHPYGTRFISFTLRDCLYAPKAPINLLSVGALVERGMSCLFSPGGITAVSFPSDHPKFPNFVLSAAVKNRLSFLDLKFVPPPAVLPTALPALAPVPPSLVVSPPPCSFPRVRLDSMLWHRRFGHIGMDATRAALLKDYVKGVNLEGSFVRDHCIPCLVGKSPQLPYAQNGNRATKIGELLHMDLCGPFPVQGPHGEKYFYNILDDKSNWGFTFGLRLKSDAFPHYLKTEAFLERSTGLAVLTIRCGGELELTAGPMGAHLSSKGIVVQRTVPYAHQQNGKSERYIRTIEEGGQAHNL